MTQSWTDDVFAPGHTGQTDLQNMEDNFQTLKSLFSGDTAPANVVAGMPWFDTAKDLLRLRNAANGSWYGVMHADSAQQIWVYRNSAMSGWTINSSVGDKVLALKGGSQAYDVSAGQTSGTWQQPSDSHNHSVDSHSHGIGSDGSHRHGKGAEEGIIDAYDGRCLTDYSGDHNHGGSTGSSGSSTSTDTHNHGSGWRPAAAIGTLQTMDV